MPKKEWPFAPLEKEHHDYKNRGVARHDQQGKL